MIPSITQRMRIGSFNDLPAIETGSTSPRRVLQFFLLLNFLLMGGCGFSSTSEQASTPRVEPSPTEEVADGESLFPKEVSAASTTPTVEVSETPAVSESDLEESETEELSGKPAEFADIADLPTQKFISTLNQLEVFKETDDQFRPYDPITRGEYLTWMFHANNAIRSDDDQLRLAPNFDPEFTDISASHPAYKYVQAFANAGYAVGYDDKTFQPDKQITREEMIVLKVGLDTGKDYKPQENLHYFKFSDADQIDERYTGYIWQDRVRKNGARAFGTVKSLKPKQVVKRHEAAATLAKIEYSNSETALARKIREEERQKKQ